MNRRTLLKSIAGLIGGAVAAPLAPLAIRKSGWYAASPSPKIISERMTVTVTFPKPGEHPCEIEESFWSQAKLRHELIAMQIAMNQFHNAVLNAERRFGTLRHIPEPTSQASAES